MERSLRSVANVTREDVRQVLALTTKVPIRTEVDRYPMADANRALVDLRDGPVHGSAVLTA